MIFATEWWAARCDKCGADPQMMGVGKTELTNELVNRGWVQDGDTIACPTCSTHEAPKKTKKKGK